MPLSSRFQIHMRQIVWLQDEDDKKHKIGKLSQVDQKNNHMKFSNIFSTVFLLFSHLDWGPATAELQTNNYKRIQSEQTVKTSPSN